MSIFLDKEQKHLEDFFRKLPKKVGARYLNHFLKSFRNQGFTDKKLVKWKGRSKKSKKKKKRGILVKTGRLQRSLKLKVTGTRIVISTATPYAEIHNEGGMIKATAKVGKYKRKGSADVKSHTRKMNTRIPKRQFMGQSDKMDKELAKMIEKELSKIFK